MTERGDARRVGDGRRPAEEGARLRRVGLVEAFA
jgi:hypothetical protein